MKLRNVRYSLLPLLILLLTISVGRAQNIKKVLTKDYVKKHYTKKSYHIEMRDGVELYTVVYAPKDTTQEYPFLMKRTPYSCKPYKEGVYPRFVSYNPYLVKEGYIFVCQDVRGRWMSEGDYTNMTPNKEDPDKVDESSDTYDTIEWLINNIPNNNGKVGMYGISYPGFYTAAALPDAHPALVASSPQAPIADFFFDDFHRNGAFSMSYWAAVPWFGFQSEPTTKRWYEGPTVKTEDDYWFYLNKITPLKKTDKYFSDNNFFWNNIVNHPNYDEFWQKRNLLPALEGIDHAVLVVGGWYDAQDLYGPLHIYQKVERSNPEAENRIIMGPWTHGGWVGFSKHHVVGDIYYGDYISRFFKKHVEAPFFLHYLKGDTTLYLPEAYMFDTGTKEWNKFEAWPPKNVEKKKFYLHANGTLSFEKPKPGGSDYSQYLSDVDNPVPATQTIAYGFIPPYQNADQRYAARRPDVLTFTSGVLQHDITISGSMLANLWVSTTGTDSDFIVKIIDIYPPSVKESQYTPDDVELDNYHQLVRAAVMRGRFRDSYSDPKPFEPGEVTYVDVPMLDIHHTFKKGHRIQIQIQSTWYPWVDINPQTFVENIYKADSSDFEDAVQRVYHTPEYPTSIEVKVLPQDHVQ